MSELSSGSEPLEALHEAQAQSQFVRVRRYIEGADDIVGYVVGVGTQWVVLSVFSDGSDNGWSVVATADVQSVTAAPGSRFLRRGLQFRGGWPSAPPPTALTLSEGADALIVSASSYFPLVTLYVEREDPYHCYIGRPILWGRSRLLWQELSVRAVWGEEACEWDLPSITRVDLGGRYEAALARVAALRGR